MRVQRCFLMALLVMTACSSSPEIRYYTLSSERPSPSVAAATARAPVGPYVFDAVTIPDLLDRPQIVLRTSPNAVEVLDYDRWAAPLPDQLQRVLAAELSARLGPNAVIDPGLPENSRADRRITVSILAFDPVRRGESSLEASWVISDVKSRPAVTPGKSFRARHVATATGSDVKDIVGTLSGLVTEIADDIAATIAAGE
jgi:uncharacterized lipoprotein YmbA